MKKLTYILLFIWNIGIGQEASEDTTSSIWTNEAFEAINTPTTISVLPIDQDPIIIRHKLYSDSSGNYIIKYSISGGGYLPLVVGAEEHSYSEIEVYKINGNDTIKIGTDPIGGVFVESGCFEDIPSEHIKDAYNSLKAKNLIIGQKATNTYGVINEPIDIEKDTPLVRISNTMITLGNGWKVVLSDSTYSDTININRKMSDTALVEDLSEFSGNILTVDVSGIKDTTLYDLTDDGSGKFKYDTVKAVLMVCDSADEVTTKFLRTGEEVVSGITSYKDTYFYWLYGFVVLEKEYGYVSNGWTRKEELGTVLGNEMRYEPVSKKTIGFLDSSKQPFSKYIIIWDYKIVE